MWRPTQLDNLVTAIGVAEVETLVEVRQFFARRPLRSARHLVKNDSFGPGVRLDSDSRIGPSAPDAGTHGCEHSRECRGALQALAHHGSSVLLLFRGRVV